MQEDSKSMAIIALATLIFLPISTVSVSYLDPGDEISRLMSQSVFGSQFFNFDPDMVRVSSSFWLFWLVSIPLTLVVLFLWRVSIMEVSITKVLKYFGTGSRRGNA